MIGRVLAMFLAVVSSVSARAEAPDFAKLRFEDSYAYLEDPGYAPELLDRLKRIPIPLGDSALSIGGEARLRYDFRQDPEWGQAPQDDRGAFLQRYLLHGDLELGDHVRLVAQLRSALEDGRAGPPSPVEEGELDLQQAFFELRGERVLGDAGLSIRAGRQEILLGSERLVSVRDGTSIRRRFDAVRGDLSRGRLRATVLLAHLTENEEGLFTDGTDEDRSLWGIYAVIASPLGLPTSIDLYYLGFEDRAALFVQGIARETRHSVGARLHGQQGRLDWNWEAVLQWGEFGSAPILAWTLATDTSYRLALPWAPRIGINANVASGDRNPGDDSLETFNPLFPRGNYFSHLALLGPRNFVNLHPGIQLQPTEGVVLAADTNFHWRLRTEDGVYGPSGNILRRGVDSSRRFVGWAISGSLDWTVSRHLLLGLVYTHGFAGGFVRDTGPSDDIDFVEVTMQVLF